MLDNIELHHLKAFRQIYKLKNITAASEKLNTSQQALSVKLKKMRLEFGDQLFVKSGHGVVPTPYAKKIFPFVEAALDSIVQIPLPVDADPQLVEKVITISATDFLQQVVVTKLIAKLSVSAPGIKLILINIESSELMRKFSAGEIDLALTSQGYVPDGLLTDDLFVEQYRCVTSNEKLFQTSPVSLADLTHHAFVVTNPSVPAFKGSADDWLRRKGYEREVAVSSSSFSMTKEIVKQTNYLAFLPSRLLPERGLIELQLESSPPGFQSVLAYHPSQAEDPVFTHIRNTIIDIVNDEVAQ